MTIYSWRLVPAQSLQVLQVTNNYTAGGSSIHASDSNTSKSGDASRQRTAV